MNPWLDPNQQGSYDWWDRLGQGGPAAPPPHQSFFGSIAHAAGNVIHGVERGAEDVGSFFGGIIKGAASDVASTATTIKNIGQAVYTDINAPKNIKANEAAYKQATADYNSGKISLEQLNQKYHAFQDTSQKIGEQLKNEGINKDKKSAAAQGGAAASTFLNLATLGVGSGVKALATGGAKEAVQTGAEQGIKAGAKKAGEILLTPSSRDQAASDAFHAAINQGGPEAAKAAAARFGQETGANALLGAGYGGVSAASNPNENSPDAWRSILLGAATGGALGGGSSLLDPAVRHGLAEVPGQLSQKAGDLTANLHGQPLNQAGSVAPFGGDASASDRPGNAVPSTQAAKPGEQSPQLARISEPNSQDALYQEVAAHYKSADDYVKETAQHAYQFDKGQSGGQLQPTSEGGYIRTSTHTPFYSQYYADHGRPPSQAAFRDQIEHALQTGTDGGGVIDPAEAPIYHLLQDREAGNQALINDPNAPHEVAQQQALDALHGPTPEAAPGATPTTPTPAAAGPGEGVPPVPPEGSATPAPGGPPGEPHRGFFDTLQNSDTSTPETKAAVGAIEPQTYGDKIANTITAQKALDIVQADPQKAMAQFLGTDKPSDLDIAIGHQLLAKNQAEGGDKSLVPIIADKLDTGLRGGGRTVQAAAIWNKLTPEGAVRYAARQIRQGREAISSGRRFEKGVGNEQKVAQELKDAAEKGAQPGIKDVTNAVRETANSKIPAGLPAKPGKGQLDLEGKPFTPPVEGEATTGEKVANRVEKAVTPAQKKQADDLVDELTKKVKQEMLPAKPDAVKKSPTDILKEVFGRNQEAQDAFPEAQRILQEKFADNPHALKTLDTFFNSELGIPSASSTIDSAIKEQLTKNESKISQIIHQSYSGQKQSVEDVTQALTKEGFDVKSAQTIAKEVTTRLDAQIADAKQRVLQTMAKDVPKRAQPSYLDRVNKMSNLGALTDGDYLALARSKLDLPQLTPDIAHDIFRLSQKMQDLPEGVEKDRVAKEIYAKVHEAIPKTKGQLAGEVLSSSKSLMATGDLSGTLRQGGVLGTRFPAEAKAAFGKQVSYFRSEGNMEKDMAALKADPDYELIKSTGVSLTGLDGSEEAFVSQLPEKIPVFGKLVQSSDRAYTGGLTQLRFLSMKHIFQDLRDSGIDPASLNSHSLESLGKYIDTASGRGSGVKGGLFEKVAPALNRTLFSPKLWKSRLDMLNPMYYARLDPIARKYALQNAGSFAGVASVVLGLAAMAGATVITDPRSSDYLKIKVGDTRYDILGGFQQNLVFAWREVSGQKKSSTTGAITELGQPSYGGANRFSILTDLIQNKENPVISAGSTILKGTDAAGQPVNVRNTLGSLAVPLNFQDISKIEGSTGDPLEAIFKAAIPGTLGVGVNTYSATPPNKTPAATNQFQKFNGSLTGS